MSGDETFILFISCVIAAMGWGRWYFHAASAAGFGSARHQRVPLYLIPILSVGLLLIVLKLAASHDVRDSLTYMLFYAAMGAAWVILCTAPMRLMGVSPRDDVLERGNRAAAYAVAGAIVGFTLCFAGGNIGDGPGWWVVVFCSGLATLTFFLAWTIIQGLGGTSELVSVERDIASGIRLGGFLVAAGLVCGRGAAGDWTGADDAIRDFVAIAWPVLPFALVEVVASRLLKPTPDWPVPSPAASGFIPAVLYIAVAFVYVWEAGTW